VAEDAIGLLAPGYAGAQAAKRLGISRDTIDQALRRIGRLAVLLT
jgi:DNA-binding CsgD family transcriptional regulator